MNAWIQAHPLISGVVFWIAALVSCGAAVMARGSDLWLDDSRDATEDEKRYLEQQAMDRHSGAA